MTVLCDEKGITGPGDCCEPFLQLSQWKAFEGVNRPQATEVADELQEPGATNSKVDQNPWNL